MRRASVLVFAAAAAFLTVVCGSSGDEPNPSSADYNSFLGASEFVAGENRFPFVLASLDGGPLGGATVQVEFLLFEQGTEERKLGAPAQYREIQGVTPHIHEDGQIHEHLDVRGFYVVRGAKFDTPGVWIARFTATTSDGQQPSVEELAFNVLEKPAAPAIGDLVPATRNLTIRDVESVEEIDTHVPPDDMHDLSVAQALQEGTLFVVVWSTPSFCISQICGPVTDVAIALQGRYRDRVNFIHIEPWDLKVARGEGRLVSIPEVKEWNLPSEPWVFIVGQDGRVVERYEGLVSSEELEGAIEKALAASSP